jgi:hypothetical protein
VLSLHQAPFKLINLSITLLYGIVPPAKEVHGESAGMKTAIVPRLMPVFEHRALYCASAQQRHMRF